MPNKADFDLVLTCIEKPFNKFQILMIQLR